MNRCLGLSPLSSEMSNVYSNEGRRSCGDIGEEHDVLVAASESDWPLHSLLVAALLHRRDSKDRPLPNSSLEHQSQASC